VFPINITLSASRNRIVGVIYFLGSCSETNHSVATVSSQIRTTLDATQARVGMQHCNAIHVIADADFLAIAISQRDSLGPA
jgi:hypothetical protein